MFEYFQVSLPITRIQSRRKTVLDALLKIRESGLLGVVSKLWLGTSHQRHSDVKRDDPSFLPAGIVQTKSVFVLLVLGQVSAVLIGIAECIVVRHRKKNPEQNSIYQHVCPTCGC